MSTQSCGNCHFFKADPEVRQGETVCVAGGGLVEDYRYGMCRAGIPFCSGPSFNERWAQWPVTDSRNWCGKWEEFREGEHA